MTNDVPSEIRRQLESYDQQHVLQSWSELSPLQHDELLDQIEALDLGKLRQLFDEYTAQDSDRAAVVVPAERPSPPRHLVRLPETVEQQKTWATATQQGERLLRAGRVGAIMVAGGQGTRLDFPHPKGMYPIGPVSDCSLFQLFAEQVLARSRRAGVAIPLYIMTSQATHDETIRFFQTHRFFGLDGDNVYFFQQGHLPALDADTGRLLLERKDRIFLSPDGHGGLLAALAKAGLIQDMADRHIDFLFYHHVDNPALKVCDPPFLGFHEQLKADISIKVIEKAYAEEKMGVTVDLGGKTQVIEYINMAPELAAEKDERGRLRLWAGSPGIHVFSRTFLERLVADQCELPFHTARKTVAHIDSEGNQVEPSKPNALKFEKFIFDTLPFAQTVAVIEADRHREFFPVKNRKEDETTPDTPEYTRQALSAMWRSWLIAAGADCPPDATVEISPLRALEPEDLAGSIQPGTTFSAPIHLTAE